MWETLCFIAGSYGILPLCAHSIAYNLIPLLYMVPLGFSIGLTVRMGRILPHHPQHAQRLAQVAMGIMVGMGGVTAWMLYVWRLHVFAMFTQDPHVIEYAQAIWKYLCVHCFVMHIFGINGGIMRGTCTLVCSLVLNERIRTNKYC
jgi:multidrug resistance protein, MATE family